MSTYPLTTSLKVVKELQWVKETIEGSTPSSPTFAAIPTNEFVVTTRADKDNKFRKLGSADLTRVVKATENYDVSISYAPIVIDVLFYSMVNLTGAQGNRENSFTFLLSQQQNSAGTLVEQYQIARGCKISSVTLTVTNGQLVNIESEWLAATASDWSTSHGLSGSPSFAGTLTATPWSSRGTGASPLTFGGNSYDVRDFSVTINHNTDRTRVLDELGTVKLQPQIRDISIDMDVVYKNTVISQDVRTLTPRSMIMNLHVESGEIMDLEFSNVYLESYDETIDANSTDAKVISYTGYATFVTLELVSSGNIVRALPTESVTILDNLSKLVHLSHVTRAVPTQTVSISDGVVIEKAIFGAMGDFATANFVSNNFILD